MSDMQPRSSFDRSLLIPIAISVVSILGICWILSTSVFARSSTPATATPSSYSFLDAGTWTPLTDTGPDAYPGPEAYPGPSDATLPSTGTPITKSRPTPSPTLTPTFTETLPSPSATQTPEGIQPLQAGKYDDTDPNIAYDPYWMALNNPSTAGSYKGTIHASPSIGNEASFRFTGKRLRLGYQRGKRFGTMTVLIDDQPYAFQEQSFDLSWTSPSLSPGDHFVRIIHQSGESVNLDYIQILD